jgi:hypothetical protein
LRLPIFSLICRLSSAGLLPPAPGASPDVVDSVSCDLDVNDLGARLRTLSLGSTPLAHLLNQTAAAAFTAAREAAFPNDPAYPVAALLQAEYLRSNGSNGSNGTSSGSGGYFGTTLAIRATSRTTDVVVSARGVDLLAALSVSREASKSAKRGRSLARGRPAKQRVGRDGRPRSRSSSTRAVAATVRVPAESEIRLAKETRRREREALERRRRARADERVRLARAAAARTSDANRRSRSRSRNSATGTAAVSSRSARKSATTATKRVRALPGSQAVSPSVASGLYRPANGLVKRAPKAQRRALKAQGRAARGSSKRSGKYARNNAAVTSSAGRSASPSIDKYGRAANVDKYGRPTTTTSPAVDKYGRSPAVDKYGRPTTTVSSSPAVDKYGRPTTTSSSSPAVDKYGRPTSSPASVDKYGRASPNVDQYGRPTTTALSSSPAVDKYGRPTSAPASVDKYGRPTTPDKRSSSNSYNNNNNSNSGLSRSGPISASPAKHAHFPKASRNRSASGDDRSPSRSGSRRYV